MRPIKQVVGRLGQAMMGLKLPHDGTRVHPAFGVGLLQVSLVPVHDQWLDSLLGSTCSWEVMSSHIECGMGNFSLISYRPRSTSVTSAAVASVGIGEDLRKV